MPLCSACISLGRYGEASGVLAAALERSPENSQLLYRFSWLLATSPDPLVRNGAAARTLAQRLLQRFPSLRVQSLDALAAAYAELGQFDEAIAAAAEAMERIGDSEEDSALRLQIEQRLAGYRAGKPYRQARDTRDGSNSGEPPN